MTLIRDIWKLLLVPLFPNSKFAYLIAILKSTYYEFPIVVGESRVKPPILLLVAP